MGTTTIARKYAKALLDISREVDSTEKFGTDLNARKTVFKDNAGVYKVLLNPMYPIEKRIGLTDTLAKELSTAKEITKLLSILVESRKIRLIPDIADQYSSLADELAGRLRVTVESPAAIDDATLKTIENKLGKETKKDIILTSVKNPALVGGLVIRIGNTIIDGSLRTQLRNMQEKILEGVV